MASYSIVEAERKLSKLVDQANAGEAVTLTRDGKPVAELKPVASSRGAVTPEMLDRLAKIRAKWPASGEDAATIIRTMRDDFP